MTSLYPSSILSITNPTASDTLANPVHHTQHATINDNVTAIETKLGVDNSAVTTSIDYLVKNAASNGGGHVQTANKGGTGQTAYTKGDVLIAASSSVLSKMSVGADGQALVTDSTAQLGLSYQGVLTAQTVRNQTNTYAAASVLSASVYGITFPQIVSVLTAGQAFQVKFPTANTSSVIALQVSSLVSQRIVNPDLTNPEVGSITASMIGIVENDGTNFQLVSRIAGGAAKFTVGNTTKSAGDASATQTIAHGLGVVPKKITLTCTNGVAISGARTAIARAVYNGTTQASQSVYIDTTGPISDNTFTLNTSGAGNGGQSGVVTVDATNISIVWTKNNASASGSYQVVWEAEA